MSSLADTIDALSQVDLFRELNKSQLGKIARVTDEVTVSEGREIVREQTYRESGGASFFIIVEGRAEVLQRGRKVARLNPGDTFGELSLLDGKPRGATVRSATPMTLYRIRSWHFHRLLKDEATIGLGLLKHLAQRVRSIEETSRRSR